MFRAVLAGRCQLIIKARHFALHNQAKLLYRKSFSLQAANQTMLYRSLGNTGLRVSEIGFGCASYWGKKVFDEAAAVRLIHTAIDHGVTLFDTGASYSDGNAEPRLGRALSSLQNKHDLVVATKAGSYTDERGKWREDFSPLGVRRTVEASLIRLGLDAIPLLHLHGPEIANITDDLLDTLARLREEGKIRHLSVNSFDVNVIEHVMTLPLFGVVMINYNILRPEREPIISKLAARKFESWPPWRWAAVCIARIDFAYAEFRMSGTSPVPGKTIALISDEPEISVFSITSRPSQPRRSPSHGYCANLK